MKKPQTQKTHAPDKKDRIDIPVPTREEVMRNLKKTAQPLPLSRPKKQRPK
jgi:hypothetical protein